MRTNLSRSLSCLGLLLSVLLSLPALAATAGAADAAPAGLDNAACLVCHDGKKGRIEVPVADGDPRELKSVAPREFALSVHATMTCVACHKDITDNPGKGMSHAKDPAVKVEKVDCAGCHEDLWEQAQKDGTTKDKPWLEVVEKNIKAYRASYHAQPNADDESIPNAKCDNCHDTHIFHVPPKDSARHAQWRLGIPNICGSCHTDQLEEYGTSVHGKEVLDNKNPKAAVCVDCHTTHSISSSSGDPFVLSVSENCGTCHETKLKSYKDTFHGQITTLGYTKTAKCFSCHGSHTIQRVDDPESSVHVDNRLKTCRNCHNAKKGLPDVPAGFATYQPHGNTHDLDRYPELWVAWQIMVQLLVGTFAFFWLHTILWFYREFQERKETAKQQRIRAEAVPAHLKGKHVRRFSRTWRAAHITFAISLMTLTLTGMPLFYPHVPWAPTLMTALGGPEMAGLIHRTAAVVFAGVFFWHLFYITYRIGRDWKNFKIFGPNSLVPNLQDGRDMLAMFKWFFGIGPRPRFDRWTYWEKFDYWAPFWGVTIIGVSGLIMWFPQYAGAVLPGWVFNVAQIFHGEEAFLAVVFLFTVHFFNNHFRPDKFPLGEVMFVGTFSLDEFKHDHAVEYERLVATGELEKHLVDAPSPLAFKASKVLGFVLIAVGLTLLTMVGIGFFAGGA